LDRVINEVVWHQLIYIKIRPHRTSNLPSDNHVYFLSRVNTGLLDLHDQEDLVSDPSILSQSAHLTTVLQNQAENVILRHASDHPDTPLFLLYAMQNVHTGGSDGLEAPSAYLARCGGGNTAGEYNDEQAYCALLIMLDEAVAKTACAMNEAGLGDNMLMVVSTDNGAWGQINGGNFPYRGSKGSLMEGGHHGPAFMFGTAVPAERRGTSYSGLVHVTDWFPSFLKLASNDAWSSPANGAAVDGLDTLAAVLAGTVSPRTEIFHNYDPVRARGSFQSHGMKYVEGALGGLTQPLTSFSQVGAMPQVCSVSDVTAPFQPLAPTAGPTPAPAPTLNVQLQPPTQAPVAAPTSKPEPAPTQAPSPGPILRGNRRPRKQNRGG